MRVWRPPSSRFANAAFARLQFSARLVRFRVFRCLLLLRFGFIGPALFEGLLLLGQALGPRLGRILLRPALGASSQARRQLGQAAFSSSVLTLLGGGLSE